jgi:hypothetical protein
MLIRLVAGEKEWDLDKSLDHNLLGVVFDTIPMLASFRKIGRLEQTDIGLPLELVPEQPQGIFGIWSWDALADCLEPTRMFATHDKIANLDQEPRQREAIAIWLKYWRFWERIREAIIHVTNKQSIIGLRISA